MLEVDRLDFPANSAFGTSMRVHIQLRIVTDDDTVIRDDAILHLDKGDNRLEA
jgi:hypothetical protein